MIAVLRLLRQGFALSNANIWQNRVALVSLLTAFLGGLLAALRSWGIHVPVIDNDQIQTLAEGIAGVGGVLLSVFLAATNRGVGFPAPAGALPPADLSRVAGGTTPVAPDAPAAKPLGQDPPPVQRVHPSDPFHDAP